MLKKATFPTPIEEKYEEQGYWYKDVESILDAYVVVGRQCVIIEEEEEDVDEKSRHADRQGCFLIENEAKLRYSAERIKYDQPDPYVERWN